MSSQQSELGPEFSISSQSQHASSKSRSRSPVNVKRDSLTNPDDDAVNQQSGSSANPQRIKGSLSATSSSQKPGDVTVQSTAPPFSLSLTLKNTGSVARDHLASERTFLAYVRTSLSFASAGVGTSVFTTVAVTFELITHFSARTAFPRLREHKWERFSERDIGCSVRSTVGSHLDRARHWHTWPR